VLLYIIVCLFIIRLALTEISAIASRTEKCLVADIMVPAKNFFLLILSLKDVFIS
jgi:hypothetical protein